MIDEAVEPVKVDTVVVGSGQAGLATGYHLARRGIDFVILDAAVTIGASWRARWDSLRMFTPTAFSHLPGLRLRGPSGSLPGKDDVAEYLEEYARRFALPLELGLHVERVRPDGEHWSVSARPVPRPPGSGASESTAPGPPMAERVPDGGGDIICPSDGERRWRARNVVIATGAHAVPRVPGFAGDLATGIVAQHCAVYRRPEQLPPGPVLVVGAGNSGAEIALELSASRPVWLAGRDVGHAPPLGNPGYRLMRALGRPGAALAARLPARGADPLGRLRSGDLAAARVRRLSRVTGVRDGLPVVGERPVEVNAVVWCTGFGPAHRFLDEPRPAHRHGVVTGRPGLYLVGVPLQTSMTSHLLGGVGHDAAYVVAHLAGRR